MRIPVFASALVIGFALAGCNATDSAAPAATPVPSPATAAAPAAARGISFSGPVAPNQPLAENQQLVRNMGGGGADPFAGQVETMLRSAWRGREANAPAVTEQVIEPPAALQAMGLPSIPRRYSYTLAPGHTYEAELPAEVRGEGFLVGLNFVGPVDADPAKGPVITVDGAEFGFLIQTSSRGELAAAAQVVVRSGHGTARQWQPFNLLISTGRGGAFPAARANLWLHLHPAKGTLDIYDSSHFLLRGDIPYDPGRQTLPVISVRTMAGTAPSVMNALTVITAPQDLSQVQRAGAGGRRGGQTAPGSRGNPSGAPRGAAPPATSNGTPGSMTPQQAADLTEAVARAQQARQ